MADSLIVLVIVAVSSRLAYVREYAAEAAADALRRRMRTRTTVLRDDRPIDQAVSEIVPGDLVLLSAGGLVPADAIIVEAACFFVSEAALTGESFPVSKAPGTAGSHVGTPTWAASRVMFVSTPAATVPLATGLTDELYVWDRAAGVIDDATNAGSALGGDGYPVISTYGRYVARTQADAQGRSVLAHYDRVSRRSTVVARQPEPDLARMSLDGRWVAFTQLDAVYVQDMMVPPDGLLPTADADADGLPNGWKENLHHVVRSSGRVDTIRCS